jgi:hydrogenase-4 component F
MGGLTETNPVLGWGLVLGVVAIAGLPPLGIFMSEFLVVSSTFAREPLLAILLVFGLLVGFGALFLRLNSIAFGMGGPLANFAGLLHMTMHSLTKSAIFFAVGHIAQVKGTQKIADMGGLTETNPVLGWGLVLGVVAIAGLPPLGIFMSEFLVVTSTFAREPWLAIILVFGILIGVAALFLRLNTIAFGEPRGPTEEAKASYVPMFAHLALVFVAGVYLPPVVVAWFQNVAKLLG